MTVFTTPYIVFGSALHISIFFLALGLTLWDTMEREYSRGILKFSARFLIAFVGLYIVLTVFIGILSFFGINSEPTRVIIAPFVVMANDTQIAVCVTFWAIVSVLSMSGPLSEARRDYFHWYVGSFFAAFCAICLTLSVFSAICWVIAYLAGWEDYINWFFQAVLIPVSWIF